MFFNKMRNVHGIFLLDKPTGISSNQALQLTKKFFYIKKAGHTGSLDPLATGLLPICFGEATKFSKYLIQANKKYRVIAKLGENTSTADSDGFVEKICKINFDSDFYESVLDNFRGEIVQVPPIYSAIKYKGQPLYKYARKGISVPIKSRVINVYQLNNIYRKEKIIELEILCSSGTYIRSIIRDLGKLLKCGAHVIFLRRIQISSYSINQSITFDQLNFLQQKYKKDFLHKLKNLIIPIHSMLSTFQKVFLSKDEHLRIKNGQSIKLFKNLKSCLVCMMNKKGVFFGLGKIKKNKYLFPYRLMNFHTSK
ncbi:tRNA pseudouridine(55) synthase TruB [Buchnera aphidicola]|uniref:tRNA pseudouridine(55) synthase TruB n=1 Tax=Buchnera aphidicola TaxID=9 RepID=UPI0020938B93|nr:tRNA pseudouridine(55) synthase TruB [Buchnera aphidicola]USS94371.1 tRNA pseudouridine(55) synthase TruB [Buchnera aphidicola (Sipha maydis)]WII23531.1 tRNA pseudouridine(55) synthase TruB [Buchnera aphidicola (Sipha maydis)]